MDIYGDDLKIVLASLDQFRENPEFFRACIRYSVSTTQIPRYQVECGLHVRPTVHP